MEHLVMNVPQSSVTSFHFGAKRRSSLNVWYPVYTHIKQQSKVYV